VNTAGRPQLRLIALTTASCEWFERALQTGRRPTAEWPLDR
jgi:hypothetical protein